MMLSGQTQRRDELLTLPEGAPRVRITAGLGTASQKSWYLRRPVTLIGSRRRAFIVLHGEAVAKAHCVIVNTGSVVMLKDLHTQAGTLCNGKQVNLTVLRDGDLVQVGSTPIQVAIQTFRTKGRQAGATGADPGKLGTPLRLHRAGGAHGWLINEDCAVIGRRAGVAVRLDHQAVSDAHALLFILDGQTALFDLASESGTFRNSQPVGLTRIDPGDRLRVGPFELNATSADEAPVGPTADAAKLALMGEDLIGAWHRLNDWHTEPGDQDGPPEDWEQKLARRAAKLDRLDARLRGRLHDLTGHQEELAAREEKLAAQLQEWEAAQAKLVQRAAELERLQAALASRERRLVERERNLQARPAEAGHAGRTRES